jgi:predicted kinase
MFNALNRALRYRDMADEYCHLSEATGLSIECRNRYVRMAEHYNALAETEEELALAHASGC